jgi:hypothetical protein
VTLSSLLILALIALMGWFLRSKHSLISKILYIISATGCILINLQQARVTLGSYGVERSHRAQASVGYVMATQLLQDSHLRKGRVLLLFPPDREAPPAALDSFYEGFARVLTRFPQIELEEITVRCTQEERQSGLWDPEEIWEVIPNEETFLACISWVGLPLAWLEDPQAQPQVDTLFYLQDHTHWRGWDSNLLTEKRLAGAVVPRLDASETDQFEEATSAAEVFQSTYQFIRPAP